MTKSITLPLIGLLFIFSSCKKISEDIQRDMYIYPDSVTFITPVIADTTNAVALGTYTDRTNFNNLIKAQDPEFGEEDIQSIRIAELKFELTDTNATNNLANFEFLNAQIGTGRTAVTIASKSENSDFEANTILLPIVNINSDLKNQFIGNAVNFSINGILRRATTKTLGAKIKIKYIVTVKKSN